MIYIVALGGGFKYPRKIHLNTQCPPAIDAPVLLLAYPESILMLLCKYVHF